MRVLKNILLSPITVLSAGCLGLLIFLSIASDSILEPMFYGINYASAQVRFGQWTEVEARDAILSTMAHWLPDLILPIVVIAWVTARLLGLQRKFRLKSAEKRDNQVA